MALVVIKWLQFIQNYTLLDEETFYDNEDGRQKHFVSITIEHQSLTSAKKKETNRIHYLKMLRKHCM